MSQRKPLPPVNPFTTRFVRPGAIPYLFPAGQTAADVVDRLAELGWRGQIVGPHGAGKSTLLAALLEPLAAANRPACVFELCDRQRRMPRGWVARARDAAAGTIVVDGYEQLSRASQMMVRLRCRRHGWGLLVTAHHDVGLPTLVEVRPDPITARAVVAHLVSRSGGTVDDDDVDRLFEACGGNVREMLFALYDRHERERFTRRGVA